MQKLLNFTIHIAQEAGALLLTGFRSKATIISYKSRTDLVTNMDHASEKLLYTKIQAEYPDHSIIAEEGSRKDAAGDYIWYIDPLDGTNNYAHGIPFFAVSIGVFSKKENAMIVGVVYNPVLNELFHATQDGGAFCNNEPITASTINDISIAVLATGFPYNKADMENNNLKEFNAFLPRLQGVRRLGAAALDLSYVAAGWLDGYWEKSLKPWDIAAGMLIAEEAKAIVTDYDGGKINPESNKIVAANKKIHAQMLEILSMTKKNTAIA